MADIKIFVCCHEPAFVPDHPLLVPIQTGAALAAAHFPGFIPDDSGENISRKNRSYCELTAQYWAWKNVPADYYGFFHYRRYLYPSLTAARPYLVEGKPTEALLDAMGYGAFGELIPGYDMILPMRENMFIPVREHYAGAKWHYGRDLETAARIVHEQHPQMGDALERYLNGPENYFGNIFIMSRPVFFDYCGWLFPILEQFDAETDMSGYAEQARRVDGYLAERLLGVYAVFHREELRVLELPRVRFEPSLCRRMGLTAKNALLPPGTPRRAAVKRILRG